MNRDTQVIKAVYKGESLTVHYWLGGYGQYTKSYCTSLSQLRRKLCRSFQVRALDLYCIQNRRLRTIVTERDLRRVLVPLHDGGTVLMNVYKHGEKEIDKHYTQIDTAVVDGDEFWMDEEDVETQRLAGVNNMKRASMWTIIDHFIVHDESCYHCDKLNIRGRRYVYKKNERYCLCNGCHRKLNRTEKAKWSDRTLPWTYSAPAGPLYYGKENDDVKQLQYLLTRLGYMNLSDTSQAVGIFGEYTENAIRLFRHKHGVQGTDSRTYDLNTAKRLASVVNRLRKAGEPYMTSK